MDDAVPALNIIVALAKTAYNTCFQIQERNPTINRIAERLHWIICRTEQWKHSCSPEYDGCNYFSLKHSVEYAHLALEAATLKDPELWRPKVKKVIGSTGVLKALGEAEASLNIALQELHVHDKFPTHEDTNKSVKEWLECFASAPSSVIESLTNQQEMDQSSVTIMIETSEVHLGDHQPSKKDTSKFEVGLDEIEFDEKDILGGGVFAKVYAGSYKKKPFKKKEVAIKCLNIDAGDLSRLSEKRVKQDALRVTFEAMWADHCSIHPSFVQVFGYHVSWKDIEHLMKRPMIIMERMHSTLFDEIHHSQTKWTFVQRIHWLYGIANALEFIHLQGIVHHDVKSLNILLNESKTEAKLADFGVTKVQGLNATKGRLSTILATSTVRGNESVPGTDVYRAPDWIYKGSSRTADMYSFGVTVLECATGTMPHKGTRESALMDFHKFPLPIEMPESNQEREKEYDAWRLLHHVAANHVIYQRRERLTATQVVRVWSQATPKEAPSSTAPDISDPGVSQSEVYAEARMEVVPASSFDIKTERRKMIVVIIMTVTIIVFTVFIAPTIAVVMTSDKYNVVEDSNQTAPTMSPSYATNPSTTPLPTSSPQQDCILSNSQLRRAVENWFDPTQKTSLQTSLGNLTDWCFGPAVTDMSNLFQYEIWFNEDVSRWDVSYVTNMKGMFQGATKFNQDLCGWGPQLQGRQVDLDNIFLWTACEDETEPDTDASPPGPFCHFCRR